MKLTTIAAVLGGIAITAGTAYARPEYAIREKKACGYCHTSPAGGGPRNPRGVYYGGHNHTFDGYDEAKVMGTAAVTGTGTGPSKTSPPAFKPAWKMDVPADSVRIAVGAVNPDKMNRLIILGAGSTATIYKPGEDSLTKEDTVDLGQFPKEFVVGGFAKGAPDVIVAPGVVYYQMGGMYAKKAIPTLAHITGTVNYVDGTQNIFYFAGSMPDTYFINLTATNTLGQGSDMPPPDQADGVYNRLTAHLPPAMLAQLGAPVATQKIGTVGFFDPRGGGKLFAWLPTQEGKISNVVVAPSDVISATGQPGDLKVLWKSPDITGNLLDVTTGTDPLTGKVQGIYVLHTTGDDPTKKVVEFYSLI